MTTLETATHKIATDGGVLQVWNSPERVYLVGDLRWLAENRLFWFTAHGDRPDDGHVLDFDSATLVADNTVEFYRDGKRVGRLSAIDVAEVDDPDDYRVAFAIWRETEPAIRPLINRSMDFADRAAISDKR